MRRATASGRREGCEVDDRVEESGYGKFIRFMDPEGHRGQPREPPPGPLP